MFAYAWRRGYVLGLVMTGALLAALLLPKCEGSGPHPFTRAPVLTTVARQAETQCTHAYGQCEVVEFIHVRANGTHWVETCFTVAAETEGHGGVFAAIDYCYHP